MMVMCRPRKSLVFEVSDQLLCLLSIIHNTIYGNHYTLFPIKSCNCLLKMYWMWHWYAKPMHIFIFICLQQETHHTEATVMDMSATSVFDVSMTSEPAVDTADTSFVPNSSPSTTTTGSSSSISGQARGWKERKWIVNESKLMELFQKCTNCGAVMCDLNQTVTQFGSRININWQCSNGHMGQWESCPNIRGMAENNLFAAAATLFTGSTYTDIADWAGLLNLQLPLEATFYNIQASYLLPVIEKSYTQQENIIKARLICQSEEGEGVQLSGDGRSDSPGHSSKYNTYSFMDDSTNQIVGFEMMQVNCQLFPQIYGKFYNMFLIVIMHSFVLYRFPRPPVRSQWNHWPTRKAWRRSWMRALM